MAVSLLFTISPIHFCLLLSILLLCYLAGLCFYRLYLHPLAKYPGPFLAKVTNLYGFYHGYRRDIHLDVWRCHEKYGSQIWLQAFAFANADSAKALLFVMLLIAWWSIATQVSRVSFFDRDHPGAYLT